MRAIRSANTKPELIVRKLLFAAGFRFRLHDRKLPGKPDIVLSRWNTVIFVNGCFWHVHKGCSLATRPASNTVFWDAKLTRNKERDSKVHDALIASGWRVLIVWECACRKKMQPVLKVLLERFICDSNGSKYAEIGRSNVLGVLS